MNQSDEEKYSLPVGKADLVSPPDIQNMKKELYEMIHNPDYLIMGTKMFLVRDKNT